MNARKPILQVLLLGGLCAVVAASCQSSCPPQALSAIEARYAAAALKACKGYPSLAECPEAPALREQRRKEEEAAECR